MVLSLYQFPLLPAGRVICPFRFQMRKWLQGAKIPSIVTFMGTHSPAGGQWPNLMRTKRQFMVFVMEKRDFAIFRFNEFSCNICWIPRLKKGSLTQPWKKHSNEASYQIIFRPSFMYCSNNSSLLIIVISLLIACHISILSNGSL